MKHERIKSLVSFIGQVLMMAVAVFVGGGVGLAAGVAVTDTPEATVVNPTETTETADGGKAVFPEQSVTTVQQAAPEVYEDQYDKLLTKIRPVRTPIDQISRRAARSKNVKSMEFKFGTIDYLPIKTTVSAQVTVEKAKVAEAFTIVPSKVNIFNRRDVIIVKGVKGLNDEDLKLWVLDRDKNTSISVIAINPKDEILTIPANKELTYPYRQGLR